MEDAPPPLPDAPEEAAPVDASSGVAGLDPDGRVAALEEQLLRLAADFDNYRRRTRAELADAAEVAQARALVDLLPVLDNLQLAVGQATEDNPLRGGLQMVIEQFQGLLSAGGLLPITAAGELFDPAVHEAVGTGPSDAEPGTIIHVVQAGYRRGDVVVRPARVIVAGEA